MKKMLAVVLFGMLCLGTFAHAQFAATGTTTLQLAVGPEAAIHINTATTTLSTSGNTFANPYTGTTNFTYKIRTSVGTGTGDITSQVTTDFASVTNGPSVASPNAGDALTYTCTAASGTACASAQTASTTANVPVVHFGADAHAVSDAGSVAWTLPNDPLYPTG